MTEGNFLIALSIPFSLCHMKDAHNIFGLIVAIINSSMCFPIFHSVAQLVLVQSYEEFCTSVINQK